MRAIRFSFVLLFIFLLSSCVGEDIIDDFVDPELRIENPLESLAINDTYQFKVKYFNNIGEEEAIAVSWSSSNSSIIEIEESAGLAQALQPGSAIITAKIAGDESVSTSISLDVSDETVASGTSKSGAIESTSSYTLRGNFTLEKDENENLVLSLDDNYKASASLPGLYVYLTNNPNSINDAFEIGAVQVFEGAHNYVIAEEIGTNDFEYLLYWCKPFSVKVGGGNID